MNVLHLIDSPDRGGTEILALDLCRNSNKNDLDITLVTTKKGELYNEFRSSGANFYLIERKMPISLKLVSKLKKIIDEKEIKVIHAHQAVEALHAYLTSLITDIKLVMTFHGHVPSKKDDLTLKFLIPKMDANIAVSNGFLRRLKDDIKFDITKNFHVIYNGIDTKKFYGTGRNFRNELKLLNTDILLGMVGNFNNDGRDQMTVCKALPKVFEKYPNVHFTFVGAGTEDNNYLFDECFNFCKANRIFDKTHFVGLRSDINDILNSLDMFVYSSNHDTFGIAVVEAMLVGLPVIINDLPPLLEVTKNGDFASVFKSKSKDDLEKKIFDLIENKDKRNKLAKAGKEWAYNQYSIEKYISNLKNLYESILNTDKKYVKSNINK